MSAGRAEHKASPLSSSDMPPPRIEFAAGAAFTHENSYICERSQADRKACKFKLSKTILGRDISKEQARKLLSAGKTDLLDSFISKRGRPFSAYLKLEDGKVSFEFPEKTARASVLTQSNIS